MEKATDLQMTVEEIVRSYREAKDKAAQVQILADLNVCSKETIRRVLVEGGWIQGSSRARRVKSRPRTLRARV